MPFDASTGWSTVAMSMYQQCTIRVGVTGTHMALWVDIDIGLPEHPAELLFEELESGIGCPSISSTEYARSYQRN